MTSNRCDCRSCQMERISNLAGIDADGTILPPNIEGGIDRTTKEWWKPQERSPALHAVPNRLYGATINERGEAV